MSLILRRNLARPLTHDELDGNLIYLHIDEWAKQTYLKGQYVLVKTGSVGTIYYCELTHNDLLYDKYGNGNFVQTYTENNITYQVWREIGQGNNNTGVTVTGYTINGTVTTIALSNGNQLTLDVNDIEISGQQYLVGVSNHSFQLMTTGWTQQIISGVTYNTHELTYGNQIQAAKQNIVIVDLNTSDDYHHLITLPTGVTINDAGVMYKIIAKNNNNINLDKYLMLYADNTRIISCDVKTKYNDSYFLPLETMESVEIIWDGFDYLVTNIVKQGYTSLNAKNFIELDPNVDPLFGTCYIERDINNLT